MNKVQNAIVGYGTGTASIQEVRAAIALVWEELRTQPAARRAAAAALEVPEDELESNAAPPLQLRIGQAGTGFVDVAIMVVTYVGTDLVWPAFRSVAEEELKKRIKALWTKVLEPAVLSRLRDRNALGPRKDLRDLVEIG